MDMDNDNLTYGDLNSISIILTNFSNQIYSLNGISEARKLRDKITKHMSKKLVELDE